MSVLGVGISGVVLLSRTLSGNVTKSCPWWDNMGLLEIFGCSRWSFPSMHSRDVVHMFSFFSWCRRMLARDA